MTQAETQTEARPSRLANAVTVLLLAAILVVGVYGFAHASLRAINPGQKPPTKHFGDVKCSVCHAIDAKAKLVEVR